MVWATSDTALVTASTTALEEPAAEPAPVAEAVLLGQTVVPMAMVLVTSTVESSGQSVTDGGQAVEVKIWVVRMVEVVSWPPRPVLLAAPVTGNETAVPVDAKADLIEVGATVVLFAAVVSLTGRPVPERLGEAETPVGTKLMPVPDGRLKLGEWTETELELEDEDEAAAVWAAAVDEAAVDEAATVELVRGRTTEDEWDGLP